MKATRRLMALAFALALVASACAGDDGGDAAAQQAVAAAEAEAAAAMADAEAARQEAAQAAADVEAAQAEAEAATAEAEAARAEAAAAASGDAESQAAADAARAEAEAARADADAAATAAQRAEDEAEAARAAAAAAERPAYKVGYISLGDSVPFVKLVSDGIKEEAERQGVELLFCDSEIDAGKALECAQNFTVQGVEGVLNFQVFEDSSPEICAALPEGIPVIAIDIVQPPCELSFMGANNRYAGYLGGSALGAYFKENFDCDYTAYISLESTAAGSANTDRMGGYRDGFTEHCPIVNERIMDGADRTDPALEQLTDLLPALPGERIAVVAINEDGIIGAIAAARTLGRDSDLYYSGQGTDPSIWCEVQNNPNYIASVAYFPERYGTILLPAIINAIEGNSIAGQLFTPHQQITSENIGDYYEVSGC
ncbi:MAG: sugar ABC transporter substrate-binding protein [Acidimicrobiia bacterium]|nr:sugar ABC transporter substrate-binding protein [Acidimicrobiia bacterium]